jgi:hypothetical protein
MYLPNNADDINSFAATTGNKPDMLLVFRSWETYPYFDPNWFNVVHSKGVTPVLAWEPRDPSQGSTQSKYSLANIAKGKFDWLIAKYARGIAQLGYPIGIRFAHEMNGNWYPWGATLNGNTPSDYVAAWQRIHNIFVRYGATNVAWMWSPNINRWTQTPLSELYPGDSYVDIVGINGYATKLTDDFDITFMGTINEIRSFTQKPMMITETGIDSAIPDKPAKISALFNRLTERGDIIGVIWFNGIGNRDWRLTATTAYLNAYKSGYTTYKTKWSQANRPTVTVAPVTPTVGNVTTSTDYMTAVSVAMPATGSAIDVTSGCLVNIAAGTCVKSISTNAGAWTVEPSALSIRFTPVHLYHSLATSPVFRVTDKYGQIGSAVAHIKVSKPAQPSVTFVSPTAAYDRAIIINPTVTGTNVQPVCLAVASTQTCSSRVVDKTGLWMLDGFTVTFSPAVGFHGVVSGPTLRVIDEVGQTGYAVLKATIGAPLAHSVNFSVPYAMAPSTEQTSALLVALAEIPAHAVGIRLTVTSYVPPTATQTVLDTAAGATATLVQQLKNTLPGTYTVSRPIRTNSASLQGTIAVKVAWQY